MHVRSMSTRDLEAKLVVYEEGLAVYVYVLHLRWSDASFLCFTTSARTCVAPALHAYTVFSCSLHVAIPRASCVLSGVTRRSFLQLSRWLHGSFCCFLCCFFHANRFSSSLRRTSRVLCVLSSFTQPFSSASPLRRALRLTSLFTHTRFSF